ncbi:LEPR-XLL domain-containing protein, partial [uncultured Marinobacter sp.]|uniref:LEPR-XLL domain-containing protein n=1 Tax=uncultured Marinobacter sp. TaxID=187379 RepID=UPI00259187BC
MLKRKKIAQAVKNPFNLEALEQRLLLSADPVFGPVQAILQRDDSQDFLIDTRDVYVLDEVSENQRNLDVKVEVVYDRLASADEELSVEPNERGFILIGSETGGPVISVNDDVTFANDVIVSAPGSGGEVFLDGSLSALSVSILGSGHTTYLNQEGVTSTKGPLLIEDSIVVSGDAHLRSAASVTVRPGSEGNGSVNANATSTEINRLEVEAVGSVTFEGNIGGEGDLNVDVKPLDELAILDATNVLFEKSVVLDGNLIINASGEVRFKESITLNDGGSLTIRGAESVVFESGAVTLNGQREGRGGDILLETDTLAVSLLSDNAIQANEAGSQFIVRPTSDNRPVLLGSTVQGTASTLNLSNLVLSRIEDASFERFVVGHQEGASHAVTVGVNGSDGSSDFLVDTDLEVYGASIVVEDSEFKDRWFKVRGDLKLDAIGN